MGKAELRRAVEAVFKHAGLDATCASCGSGPAGANIGVLVVREGERLRSCERCGFLLDQIGRPVGSRDEHGRFCGRLIILMGERDAPSLSAWPFVGEG